MKKFPINGITYCFKKTNKEKQFVLNYVLLFSAHFGTVIIIGKTKYNWKNLDILNILVEYLGFGIVFNQLGNRTAGLSKMYKIVILKGKESKQKIKRNTVIFLFHKD